MKSIFLNNKAFLYTLHALAAPLTSQNTKILYGKYAPMIQHFFLLPEKIRFLFVGGLNTGISYILFVILLFFMGEAHYQKALALAWILSSFISFTMQKIFVFQSKGAWLAEYVRCLATWAIAYAINAGVLELSVRYAELPPYAAQLFALAFTTILTYFLFKYFAFKPKDASCPNK